MATAESPAGSNGNSLALIEGGPADSSAVDAWAHVERVVKHSGSSFLAGMRVLPPDRRSAMHAIYAFCREVDDIADDEGTPSLKRSRLAAWRAEVERVYAGAPTEPTGVALHWAVRRYDLPRPEFHAILDGMETDAAPRVRMGTAEDLYTYCRRVAGAVGVLSVRAFGIAGPPADALAVTLGNALQLTNILRDIAEDAARNRVYLPSELLNREGVRSNAPCAAISHPRFEVCCREVAEWARRHFRETEVLLRDVDRRSMRPAIMMMEAYRRILDRLERRGWRQLTPTVRLSRPEKLWIAFRYGLL